MIGSRELHAVPIRVVSAEQFERNEWLAESLKMYCEYRCQICGHSFQPTYGVDYAEMHHIQYPRLAQRGSPL
jgi:predicted HNH restriction endonuclease